MPRPKPKTAAARRASSRTTATPRPPSSESSLSPLKSNHEAEDVPTLDPDLLGQVDMLEGLDVAEGEENADAALLEELEMGLGIIPSADEPADVDMTLGTGDPEEESDDADEGEAEEDEDEEDEEDDEEEEEEEDDEEDEEEEDEEEAEEDDDPPREEWIDCPEEMTFRYPASVPDFNTLNPREQAFKCARFLPCQAEGCQCEGLEPPMSSTPELQVVSRADINAGELEELDAPAGAEEGAVEKWRSEEGWWRYCGRCGHGWEGSGHVFAADETRGERVRKGRVVGRIEEFLEVRLVSFSILEFALIIKEDGMLTKFPTPRTEKVASLLKQLHEFVRTSGKKPAGPPTGAFEPGSPGGESDGTPMTGHESDEERPRKKSRRNGSALADGDQEDDETKDDDPATSPRHGKKPGGKSAGKGTKPRTVVRGMRGLVPMEVEADGNQHPAGDLPESAKAEDGGEGLDDDEEEDDVPLAKRPELDEKERKRRELAKEKAREKEDEVVRRTTKGTNVDQDTDMADGEDEAEDVEVWHGVKLVRSSTHSNLYVM